MVKRHIEFHLCDPSFTIFNLCSGLAIVSPHEDVPETDMLLKEENLKINENKSPDEADATETVLEIVEMDAKQNDINDSFKRFFSNINLKLTVKRGSAEKDDISADVPDDTTKDEPNRSEGVDDTVKENKSENAEHNTDLNAAQETYDHDSICPTMTDITSEDVLDNAEEKTTEIKEDVCSENAGPKITLPIGEDERVQQNATSEEEAIVSPIKRFFTSGIFSGLRKKKKPAEDEIPEKEMVDVKKEEAAETTDTVQVQEHDKEISLGIEAFTVEKEHKGTGLKEQVQSAASAHTIDEGKSPSTDPSTIIMNESEILSSQEKDKVQASPLKRLLSGSSLKKSAKKQKERKSSDAKMSDSGEHVSNQLLSSSDGADNQKEETPPGEEDGAWASFKKLVTPKKRVKRSSLTNEETQNPSSVQESKSSEGEQISDHSTEESKKRKDSLVSWEAVLCGSGRRRSRSRKTSDSEDEKPQIENDNKKQDSPLESSNEVDESLASYTKQAGNTSEGDGGSTWKSFKKLVTPKKKVKDDNIQSDGEVTQDDSLSSIKKLLPGQKKRRHGEKQDYLSSDEADEEVVSGDEDSETPAVVPLSEFDTTETGVSDYELLLQSEAKQVQEKGDALENETSTTPASNEEPDEITELISKHQQLSDIPEEGIITETMVTPASVTEEPARDDTIAEDLIEMTSEAITAPEPVDITLADETEMISAVSQLSDSSKTSGNTTPVPAEYEIKDTEVLLQQVVENISADPNAVPLFSDEIISEKLVASVSCQILEKFVKQQPTILEMHTVSDATTINTDLNELDTINGLAAKAQMEIVTEVNEAVPTEIAPEASAEFDNAEIAVDEDSITHTEKNLKEVEMINESQDLMECQSEMCDTASIEFLVQIPGSKELLSGSILQEEAGTKQHKEEDKTEAFTEVHVDPEKEDELQVIFEETLGPRIDNATITYESKSEVHLNEVQDNVEGEKEVEIPGAEIQTSSVEHAIVGQLMTCNLKEVSAAIPDVVIEKTSEIPELLIDTVANELEFKEETEIATPLMRDDVTDTATEHSVVMMMNVPSAAFEDNHRIQVQVVEVDIGSTDIIVDSALEVGVTEAKDIIDVCHETIKVTNKFSATEETEEELITKENKMINHKVIQHVKEIVPEKVAVQTTIQDEAVNLEHILQPDVTELSEMVESKSNQEESQKAMENTSETISQRQDEVLANSDGPASEQLVCDVKQTPNIPGSSSGTVSILYHKDCFKEQKNELKQSEADVTAELLESNKITEEAKIPQSAQSHTVIVKKTGLEVPQNTGIISSIGNLESPSSLSLEFKLNIQFGQAKAPASTPLPTENTDVFPQPATERTEPVKQTNVSDIGVHAVEHQNTINAILETQKKTVLTEVTVQATEIPEPKPENFNSTERSVIINQPVLLDISIQAMEKVQTAEQIKSIERTTPNVQATEKILAVMQTEKSEDFLSRPVLYEACTEEITIEEHVLQIEEENDQDLWVDAEEDIHAPEESDVPIVIVEGPVVHQKESDQEEKARLDRMAPETTPKSKTKEEESQKEMHKMEEIESEEFAVALEHPETATTTATM
uniref:A kinase-anchoring proteins AKAP-5 and AKAP-12 calmodulin (CaM)-binding domain-containing protein n=1 Tax=Anabas testudineus TaxID=64144 RepID=A0A7N5ZUU8_ANATE